MSLAGGSQRSSEGRDQASVCVPPASPQAEIVYRIKNLTAPTRWDSHHNPVPSGPRTGPRLLRETGESYHASDPIGHTWVMDTSDVQPTSRMMRLASSLSFSA
jgi:hypothetical protein